MATMITEECINCGACEPECPNTAHAAVQYELNARCLMRCPTISLYRSREVHGMRVILTSNSVRRSVPWIAASPTRIAWKPKRC
jgi:NAD-dependent dihydropyrimidine dehydrogenase PreA subunit